MSLADILSRFHTETCQVELAFATLDTAKTIMNGRNVDQRTLSFLLYVEGLICNDTNRLERGVQSFSQARDLLEAAMKQETRTPIDPKNLLHIYSAMGNTLTSSNRFVEAEECQRKAISLYLAAGEIVEERLGRLYVNLGSCLLWKGDLVAAEATLHKALLRYDRKLCCTLYALGNVLSGTETHPTGVRSAPGTSRDLLETPRSVSSCDGRLMLQGWLHPFEGRFP